VGFLRHAALASRQDARDAAVWCRAGARPRRPRMVPSPLRTTAGPGCCTPASAGLMEAAGFAGSVRPRSARAGGAIGFVRRRKGVRGRRSNRPVGYGTRAGRTRSPRLPWLVQTGGPARTSNLPPAAEPTGSSPCSRPPQGAPFARDRSRGSSRPRRPNREPVITPWWFAGSGKQQPAGRRSRCPRCWPGHLRRFLALAGRGKTC